MQQTAEPAESYMQSICGGSLDGAQNAADRFLFNKKSARNGTAERSPQACRIEPKAKQADRNEEAVFSIV